MHDQYITNEQYIINEVVVFHPATSTLCDIRNRNTAVTLNSPAGRCFLLLISKAGSIVTQHEVMDFVWSQRGMYVTSNSYYQNISLLRKGLKAIGLGHDVIVTIPRIGLTLSTEISIKKIINETVVTEGNYNKTDAHIVITEGPRHGSSKTVGAQFSQLPLTQKCHQSRNVCVNDKKSTKTALFQNLRIASIVALIFSFITFFYFKIKSSYFSVNTPMTSMKECAILLSQHF